jgi:hypothetical protein
MFVTFQPFILTKADPIQLTVGSRNNYSCKCETVSGNVRLSIVHRDAPINRVRLFVILISGGIHFARVHGD